MSLPPLVRSLSDSLRATEQLGDETKPLPSDLHPAAVLVLLYRRPEEGIVFPLTVRLDSLTHHPGQISLPGGRIDDGDRSGWDAALRETREELGARTGRIRRLGSLQPVPTVVSNHLILPYAGWSPVVPRMSPQPTEVADVLEVPLTALTDPANIDEETWELRGRPYIVTFYRIADAVVWGATARVLSNLAMHLGPGSFRLDYPPGAVRPADAPSHVIG